jgi:hypothetical protein
MVSLFASFSGIGKIIFYGLMLFAVFYVYLLFTQPQNALHYAEVMFTAIFKIISGIFYVVYKVLEALVKLIARLFKRRR